MEHHERRLEARVGRCETIFIELFSADYDESSPAKIIICNTLDISANGLQLVIDSEVPVGSVLQLGVDLNQPKQRIHMVGEVRWCRRQLKADGDSYLLGFELYESEGTDIEIWKRLLASEMGGPPLIIDRSK